MGFKDWFLNSITSGRKLSEDQSSYGKKNDTSGSKDIIPENTQPLPPNEEEKPSRPDGLRVNAQSDQTCTLRQSYARLLRERKRALHTLTEMQIARQHLSELRAWYKKSAEELLVYIRDQGGGRVFQPDELTRLRNQVELDADAEAAHTILLNSLETKLGNLQFHLQGHEAEFSRLFDAVLQTTGVREAAKLDTVSVADDLLNTRSESIASSTQHPLLEAYYDTWGTVARAGECLAAFDVEHKDAMTRRLLQHDQGGEPASHSDSFYDSIYRNNRALIEQDLATAMGRREEAKQQCIAAGLDADAALYSSRRLGASPGSARTISTAPDPSSSHGAPVSIQILGSPENMRSDVSDASGRVLQWTNDIAGVQQETTIFDLEEEDKGITETPGGSDQHSAASESVPTIAVDLDKSPRQRG